MKLRSNISLLLIVVLLWNTSGWLFMGLIQSGMHHHEEDLTHCEIGFCYCEVSAEETICSCHHEELHAANHSSGSDHDMHSTPDHESGHLDMCFFAKPDTEPDTPTPIFVDQLKTILSSPVGLIASPASSLAFTTNRTLLNGYDFPILRPPSV